MSCSKHYKKTLHISLIFFSTEMIAGYQQFSDLSMVFIGQTQDNMIEWQSQKHPVYNIPLYSLYGEHRKPTPEMLKEY